MYKSPEYSGIEDTSSSWKVVSKLLFRAQTLECQIILNRPVS